jgi:hypothetical protein
VNKSVLRWYDILVIDLLVIAVTAMGLTDGLDAAFVFSAGLFCAMMMGINIGLRLWRK